MAVKRFGINQSAANRAELESIATELSAAGQFNAAQRIRAVVQKMVRRKPMFRTERHQRSVTQDHVDRIIAAYEANPDQTLTKISTDIDINVGTISHVLRNYLADKPVMWN